MCGAIATILIQIRAQELSAIDGELKRRSEPFVKFAAHHLFQAGKATQEPSRAETTARLEPLIESSIERTKPVDGLPVDRETERIRWFRMPSFVGADGRTLARFGKDVPWDASALVGANRAKTRFSVARWQDEPTRVLSTAIFQHGDWTGSVQMATPIGDFNRQWSNRVVSALLMLMPALAISMLGGLYLTGRALKPVDIITRTAAMIGDGDLSQRLKIQGDDELSNLAKTFNAMIGSLEQAFHSRDEAYRQLRSAFERQKRFTADAAHELRTPLTRIMSATSVALATPGDAEKYHQALVAADEGVNTMADLVSQLLLLARADSRQTSPLRAPVDLVTLANDVISMIGGDQIRREFPDELIPVPGDEALLECLIRNLIENAMRYGGENVPIQVTLKRTDEFARLLVADRGPGIDPRHLPYLFDRFYRAEESRISHPSGAGLGLSICESIVETHGGKITVDSEVGKGTTFTVQLPLWNPNG